jgi:hypothetical protein
MTREQRLRFYVAGYLSVALAAWAYAELRLGRPLRPMDRLSAEDIAAAYNEPSPSFEELVELANNLCLEATPPWVLARAEEHVARYFMH